MKIGGGWAGGQNQYQLSQGIGAQWDGGSGLLSFELYEREALAASERRLTRSSDFTAFGGQNFDTLGGNPGTIVDFGTGQTWAIPANQNGVSLEPEDFVAGTSNRHNL